jgi:hypothetical protein
MVQMIYPEFPNHPEGAAPSGASARKGKMRRLGVYDPFFESNSRNAVSVNCRRLAAESARVLVFACT